jgi:hypothetical protein
MEEINNIISTIISTKEITYRQINYLISKSESLGIDVTKELVNYDIKLNGKDAEKELKWLRKGNNLRLCGWREKNAISNATANDIIFKGLHEFGVSMYEPYYYINGIAYTHGDTISIVG